MKKKKETQKEYIEKEPILKNVVETLETNYMPYAMSVILSRAIPEIDGLKPAHRKLLYTMYKKGLLTGDRTKSANIVGETMKLNPHGDGAIYETMVRLARGYEALPLPFIDSKGNFGKVYSRDMAYAASRYTEAKLAPICRELFDDIDKDTVDFIPNYDNSMQEPALLPVSFPTILTTPNQGIAVGMASNICSFNLAEVCDTVIALLENPDHPLELTLPGPDFSTGGQLLVGQSQLKEIYETGRGTLRVRARFTLDPASGMIQITEIPYTTTIEAVIDKIIDLVKAGKLREIADVKDMSDKTGLRISIEPKRGTDAGRLMAKLFKMTPLEDSFGCNFNVLIGGTPQVLGVRALIDEWIAFRAECLKRRTFFSLGKARERLHLLLGLKKILLDIDKAVSIVRETEREEEVVPNLMIGFGVDEIQAEYIANIRLRYLNQEYILNRLSDIDALEKEIADLEGILKNKNRIYQLIKNDLKRVKKQYPAPRRTELVYEDQLEEIDETDHIEDYAVTYFLSRGGYFKKITPQSLRMNSAQKYKDGDALNAQIEAGNKAELIFFTSAQNAYKARGYDFEDAKASLMGDYLPAKLEMEADETVVAMAVTGDYSGDMVFFFENGKAARVPLAAYKTVTNRRRLVNAFSDKSPLVAAFQLPAESDFVLISSNQKALIISSALIPQKATKSTLGVTVMTQKGKNRLERVTPLEGAGILHVSYYRTKNIPAVGHLLRQQDLESGQSTLP
ncbi:MAG: topoisomerase IV [Clostridiales bacterium]|nr:MAG: topoisomerase IV [Clostridiales bacterium]